MSRSISRKHKQIHCILNDLKLTDIDRISGKMLKLFFSLAWSVVVVDALSKASSSFANAGKVSVKMPTFMKAHMQNETAEPVRMPLVLFSTAQGGAAPISAYSTFTSIVAQHAIVWSTGTSPPPHAEVLRVQSAMNVKFDPIMAFGHSTGAGVARRVPSSTCILLLDPVEAAADAEWDGTAAKRAILSFLFPLSAADVDCNVYDEPAREPNFVVVTGDGKRVSPASTNMAVRVKDACFEDIFDAHTRRTLRGDVAGKLDDRADTCESFREWMIGLMQSMFEGHSGNE